MFKITKVLLCSGIAIFLSACDKPSSSRVSTSFNTGASETTSQAPYLLPRCFDADEPQDLKIVISAVGSDTADSAACAVKAGAEKNQDFSLDWSTSAVASTQVRVAEVNVSSAAVYSGREEDRNRLKASFEAFMLELSALEEKNCLNGGDTAAIRDRVASALPLRLDEILPYHYGFDPTNRVIDLQPGMRLRVEQGAYQYIDPEPCEIPGECPDHPSAAYVGTGNAYLQVVRRPDQKLAFEPYLGANDPIKAVGENTETGSGRVRAISGAMGLAAAGMSHRYARLVYPPQYPTTDNTNAVAADNELPFRVGLLLADRMEHLQNAANEQISSSGCADDIQCAYFTGRSFVIPEVLVRIQGVEKYVALGTTVRDAVGQYAVMPTRQIGNRDAGGFSPVLQRWVQPGLCRGGSGYQTTRILFEQQSPVMSSNLSQWDMPLLKGDELHW